MTVYPFSAIVGQEEMKLALLLNAIDPLIGGVLMMGQRGTGKSTAVRGLAELLPQMKVVRECIYRCDPATADELCTACAAKLASGAKLQTEHVRAKVVTLPLGATEDRVCGTIDIERALQTGIKAFEPGLLAGANRGFLYIDEVNLLDDHLVDLLLDAAATGRNQVEREGISVEHPARFVLIGSGNPEEGELRPQLQDRFGLYVDVTTDNDAESRAAVVEKREAFDRDPVGFLLNTENQQTRLRNRIKKARTTIVNLPIGGMLLRDVARLCSDLHIEGHRGELTITRAARALAAFKGRGQITIEEVKRVAPLALRHRLRRDVLEETASATVLKEAMERVFATQSVGQVNTNGESWSPSQSEESRDSSLPATTQRAVKAQGHSSPDPSGVNGGNDQPFRLAEPAALNSTIKQLKGSQWRQAPGTLRYTGGRSSFRSSSEERGRYRRPVGHKTKRLAVEATLRMMAGEINKRSSISNQSLRYKLFTQKGGSLFIFAIDTSGSMALNRIRHAKGALLHLLKRSYINRDRVALVGFGGGVAKLHLPPSRSILRARRVLDSLSVGGGTPLSAGLVCALEVARRATLQEILDIRLLLFTDGRANLPLQTNFSGSQSERRLRIDEELESLGLDLRRAGVSTTIVDTGSPFAPAGEAARVAAILKAQLVKITSSLRSIHY